MGGLFWCESVTRSYMTALIELCFGERKASKKHVCLSSSKCWSIAMSRNSWNIDKFDFFFLFFILCLLLFPSFLPSFISFALVMASTFTIQGQLEGTDIIHGCTTILHSQRNLRKMHTIKLSFKDHWGQWATSLNNLYWDTLFVSCWKKRSWSLYIGLLLFKGSFKSHYFEKDDPAFHDSLKYLSFLLLF